MEEKIKELRAAIEQASADVTDKARLSDFWQKYLSKNGEVAGLTKSLRDVPKEDRPAVGKTINEFKQWAEGQYQALSVQVEQAALAARNAAETVDITMPPKVRLNGSLHPITLVKNEIVDVFAGMGFEIYEGPEIEDDDEIEIRDEDIEMQVYRASGAGGQHVNKTESAIRITHLPTGTVVECQDERSQYKNKDRAMKILASRLYAAESARQNAARSAERRSQVGTGMRNERIRTYNFPQGRVTDHRIGLTLYKLDQVLDGDLDEIIDALTLADQAEKLRASAEEA